MATRLAYVGDTYPPIKGQATDETGVLDLSGATGLECVVMGRSFMFSGTATAIWPAEADDDGIHHWNWYYDFASDDLANADEYDVYLTVTWSTGVIETFGPDTLLVKTIS